MSSSRPNWDRARRRERRRGQAQDKRVRLDKPVHPNSMAARKWGREVWRG